jgi:DASH complex subunit DAD1
LLCVDNSTEKKARHSDATQQVGREFESVEALWNQFEVVMGRNPVLAKAEEEQAGGAGDEDTTMEG